MTITILMAASFALAPWTGDDLPVEARSLPVALLPRGLSSFGAAASDGWLYVLGGYFGTPHRYSNEGQSRSFARLNLADLTSWEELPGTDGLQSVALVAHEGALYRVGGLHIENAAGEPRALHSTRIFARFEPLQGTWEELPPLPAPRSSHEACTVGDTLYVFGGWDLDGDAGDARWHADGLAIDLSAPDASWTSIPAPFERRACDVVALDGRVLVVGGMDALGEVSARVDVFDPHTATWSQAPDFPGRAFAASAAVAGDAVYASGADGFVHRWRHGAPAWEPVCELAFPRMFHQLVATGEDELLAIGGIAGMEREGRTRHIESIALDGEEELDRCVTWTLPAPGRAKNRQGIFLHGDALHFFGGNRSTEQHDFDPDDFLAEGFALHLPSLSWSPIAALPSPRQSVTTEVVGHGVLALGGFGHDGEVARSFASAWLYDLEADAWRELGDGFPTPRTQFGLARHADELWVFGGLDYDPRRGTDSFLHATEVLVASAVDDAPRFVASDVVLPEPRRAFAGAALAGSYYLVGGMREGFALVDTCDRFDFERRTWSQIPAPRRTRLSAQLVALDGRLYLGGGSARLTAGGEFEPDPSIEVFDPATGAWSVLVEELPIATRHARLFAWNGRLLVHSAHDEERDVVRLCLVDVR